MLIIKPIKFCSKILISIILLLLVFACKDYNDIPYTYKSPENLSDSLQVANIADVKIDSNLIYQSIKRIKGGALGQTHSILVYRDNKLVVEEYFSGNKYIWDAPGHYGEYIQWNKNDLHNIMSVNKSITAACIGIAIDKGMIKSVKQSIFDYLPEHQQFKNNGKENITIEHLLTMTSGLDWTEWGVDYSSPENPIIGIWFSDKDPVSFILDAPLVHKPGTYFSYYGGNQILLGEILKNATGIRIDEFSSKYLFEPLGIHHVEWTNTFKNGVIECAANLKMTPRDMLKIGITFLNDGRWNQTQLISHNWIKKSSQPYANNIDIKIPGEDSGKVGYAYSWWTKEHSEGNKKMDIFMALGWGGQKIIIIPEKKAVIVFTGGEYNSGTKQFDFLVDYIIPAMK